MQIDMYVDGKQVDAHHFEVKPGQKRRLTSYLIIQDVKTVLFATKHRRLQVTR